MMTLNLCPFLITSIPNLFQSIVQHSYIIVTGNRVDFEPLQVQSVTYNGDLIQLMSELFHKNIERTLECHGVVSINALECFNESCFGISLHGRLSSNINPNIIDACNNKISAKFLVRGYLGNSNRTFAHFKTPFWLVKVYKTQL